MLSYIRTAAQHCLFYTVYGCCFVVSVECLSLILRYFVQSIPAAFTASVFQCEVLLLFITLLLSSAVIFDFMYNTFTMYIPKYTPKYRST